MEDILETGIGGDVCSGTVVQMVTLEPFFGEPVGGGQRYKSESTTHTVAS